MGRRIGSGAQLAPADVDREAAEQRFRQLSLRLRMCAPDGSDLQREIHRGLHRAEGQSDPLRKLADLQAFAAEIRPQLPPAVARHALPGGLLR